MVVTISSLVLQTSDQKQINLIDKGRAVGVPNYKNDLLINVIEAILPDGAIQWKLLATRYKEVSGEVEERDSHDIKRHFTTVAVAGTLPPYGLF